MTVQNLFQSWSLQLKQTGSSSCLIQLEESSLFLWFRGALLPETFWLILSRRRSFFSVAFSFPSVNFSTSLSETSANLPECSSSSEKVSMWKFGHSSRKSPVTIVFAPRSHFVIEISKEQAARLRGKLSCNWLIILVTMATPISSHVKDKNHIIKMIIAVRLMSSVCFAHRYHWKGEGGRVFPGCRLIGMCRWMGSHFHDMGLHFYKSC